MKKEKLKWAEMTKKQKVIHIIDYIMKSLILIIIGVCVIYGIMYNAKDRGKVAKANTVTGGNIGISKPSNGNDVFEEVGKRYPINTYDNTNNSLQVIWSLGEQVKTESAKIKVVQNIETDVSPIKFYNEEAKSWDEVYYFDCYYGREIIYTTQIWAYHEERGVYNTECGFEYRPEYQTSLPDFEENLIVRIKPYNSFRLAFNYKEPIFNYENTETGEILENLNILDNPDFIICKALMCLQNGSLTSDKIYSDAYTEGYITGTDEGYYEGENAGYQNGYNIGYAEGKSQATTFNPIGMMIEPVAKLLDVKLFGNFSIGNFFTAALFVTLAISFMKMFAGG